MADAVSGIIQGIVGISELKPAIGPEWGGGLGPVIVYGTGNAAIQLLERHGAALGAPRFANTDGSGMFQGQAVMAAQEIALIPEARIVIASSFIMPILLGLYDLGISGERICWYHAERDGFLDGDIFHVPPRSSEILHAFYDLGVHRTMMDAATFATLAEAERQRRGLRAINVVLVPAAIRLNERLDRAAPDAEAIFALLPSVHGRFRLANRAEATMLVASADVCFPPGYDPAMPRHEAGLRQVYQAKDAGFSPCCLTAPETAKQIVAGFLSRHLGGRRLLTLSLREFPGGPDRTVSMGDWLRLIGGVDRQRYLVIVLRHAKCAFDALPPGLSDCIEFPQASTDITCRMALYEAAVLNLMDHQDYAALVIFSASHYLLQKPHLPICFGAQDRDELATRYGMMPGDTFPLAGPGQHFLSTAADLHRILAAETGDRPGEAGTPIARQIGSWFPDDDLSLAYARNIGVYNKFVDVPIETPRAGLDWQEMLDDPDCGIFLTLGQSNGANAGESCHTPSGPVYSLSLFDMCCTIAADPLSGATSQWGSIWSRLGDLLVEHQLYRRILFLPVAVSGSSVAEWMPGDQCFRRLALLISRMHRMTGRTKLPITAILWVQGETDANHTIMSAEVYAQQFLEFVGGIRDMGVKAPVLMAHATLCGRGEPPQKPNRPAIRRARDLLVAGYPDILAGPDLDELGFDLRFDDCHLSREGLRRAAMAWLDSLTTYRQRLSCTASS